MAEAPDQDLPLVTTVEQAQATIQAIARPCRGALGSRQLPADASPAERGVRADQVRQLMREAIERGDQASANALNDDTRVPCGYDFNEIVVMGPWDGQVQEYTCPRCGAKGTYRAPLFPDLKEARR